MQISCPRCRKKIEAKPDEVIGRFFICQKCHYFFLWEKQLPSEKNSIIDEESLESSKQDSHNDLITSHWGLDISP